MSHLKHEFIQLVDFDKVKYKLKLGKEIPLKQQERGYTSAIWYSPAK